MSELPLNIIDNEPAHYELGPSSASRWKNCPGSVNTPLPDWALPFVNLSSEAADRGTLGHAIAESILRGEELDPGFQAKLDGMEDAARGYLLSQVQECVDYVSEKMEEHGSRILRLETKIKSKLARHGGTIDVLFVTDDLLHVIDFKFGDVYVDPEDNDQIKNYLNLAREEYPGRKRFLGTIVQPSTSEQTADIEYTEDELLDDRLEVIEASCSTEFKAGSWCKYCPRASLCQYNRDDLAEDLKKFKPIIDLATIEKPTPEDVALVEEIVALARRASKAEADGSAILKAWADRGLELGSHHIRTTYRRYWSDADKAQELFGYEKKPLSVTKAISSYKGELTKEEFLEQFKDIIDERPSKTLVSGKPKEPKLNDPLIKAVDSPKS